MVDFYNVSLFSALFGDRVDGLRYIGSQCLCTGPALSDRRRRVGTRLVRVHSMRQARGLDFLRCIGRFLYPLGC